MGTRPELLFNSTHCMSGYISCGDVIFLHQLCFLIIEPYCHLLHIQMLSSNLHQRKIPYRSILAKGKTHFMDLLCDSDVRQNVFPGPCCKLAPGFVYIILISFFAILLLRVLQHPQHHKSTLQHNTTQHNIKTQHYNHTICNACLILHTLIHSEMSYYVFT